MAKSTIRFIMLLVFALDIAPSFLQAIYFSPPIQD